MSKSIQFGTPSGVKEGDWFANHDELHAKGVHRFRGQGISGTASDGVDSIVMSGGYIDDDDRGDEIIYTGRGGRDRSTGRLVADQSMDESANAGLVLNRYAGYPVRVVEGLDVRGKTRRRPMGGYRYRGLYRVEDHWMTVGKEGFVVCQFRLVKMADDQDISPQPIAGDDETPVDRGETPVEKILRRYTEQQRLIRDSAVVHAVKAMYDHTCQICDERIVVSPTGEAYSEAAHIRAVGKPHNGPDVLENVLCLCPNCHAKFDRGALQLTDALEVIDGLTQKHCNSLRRREEHKIGIDFVRSHRTRWKDRQI